MIEGSGSKPRWGPMGPTLLDVRNIRTATNKHIHDFFIDIMISVPDPGWLSRIRIFPSRIQGQKIPGSRIRIRIKEFKYFNLTQKIVFKLSEIWGGIFIPDADLDFLSRPDLWSRGKKGAGSRIRIRNTDNDPPYPSWIRSVKITTDYNSD